MCHSRPLLRSLVVSVGGLSEDIVKEASGALLALCNHYKQQDAAGLSVRRVADLLPRMFAAHRGDDRVAVPLLKTTDLLLRSGALDTLRGRRLGQRFAADIHAAVAAEHATSQDVGKIRACADVHLLLLQWAEPVRTAALKVKGFVVVFFSFPF